MFRRHALGGVSVLALMLAAATVATANHDLPAVTVDAPAPVKRVTRKPAQPASSIAPRPRIAATATKRQVPILVVNAREAA